ncbi:50S ribosomal protein L24 [Candidatus Nitrosotenuis sp. DW1]|uniref:50S ribosomal protein L24 n=1 Tax=Candidatus Nitrosotenuis sp. DW1 TaxID=2259672 RepID=UPI0015CA5E17|nr:50S ribosomal protein L24 [Candidatus Nitrosotenuis sp. DW1]QLH08868.1 50S ribosomal protein L24 [Candidatus Nitrosotenuis sp. DW1]
MKPTTIRNRMIYQATAVVKSKQLSSHLSKELQKKYNKRSIRIIEGDTIRVLRGEFRGVTGKITNVSTPRNGVSIEGVKKEKLKGGNLDVFIHPSNLIVTELNTEDKWRQNKLEGKKTKPVKEAKPKEAAKPAPKKEAKAPAKQSKPKETKESKPTKTEKKKEEK